MEASDISRITYELIRQHDDRLLMKWEGLSPPSLDPLTPADDRGYLIREIHSLKKQVKKDKRTSELLKLEINRLYDTFHGSLKTEQSLTTTNPKRKHSANFDQKKVEEEKERKMSSKKPAVDIPQTLTEVPQQLPSRQSSFKSSCTGITSRSKSERDVMNGHECEECQRYYRIMEQQGLIITTPTNLECGLTETLRRCSRHKSHWSPPCTPEGFWDLTIRTPDDWKS
jgi:hypothetical protein